MKKFTLILSLVLIASLVAGCAGTPVIYYTDCTCPVEHAAPAETQPAATEAPALEAGDLKTGLAIIARASAAIKQCDKSTLQRIENILKIFNLPCKTDFSADALCSAALADKKRTANIINLIITIQIGECIIKPTHITELKDFIEAGL